MVERRGRGRRGPAVPSAARSGLRSAPVPSHPTWLRPLLLVVATAALGACGSTTSPAATVNGTDISEESLRDELAAAAEFAEANPGLVALLERGPGGNFSGEAARQLLQQRVEDVVLTDALRDLGGTVTDDDRAQLADIDQGVVATDWLDTFAGRQETRVAVQREILAEAGVATTAREWFERNADQLADVVCVRHLLVEDADEAAVARRRIVDGADPFAEVAAEVSIDPGSAAVGGDLGCSSPERYVEPFAEAVRTAEVGAISDVVETDFGFHVIEVQGRGPDLDFEAVEALATERWQLESAAIAEETVNEELLSYLTDADVEISPRYGSWNGRTVVSPLAPEDDAPLAGDVAGQPGS